MKVKSALLGLASVGGGLLMSGSIANADGYSAPARYAAPTTWSGCYLGVSGGWAWGHSDQIFRDSITVTSTDPTKPPSTPNQVPNTPFVHNVDKTIASIDMDGGLIGGTFGCNLQVR